jgi:thiol-disulfide isomerase/thioredoxin
LKHNRKFAAAAIAGLGLATVLAIVAISDRQSRKDAPAPSAPPGPVSGALLSAFERHESPRPLADVRLAEADGTAVDLSAFRGRVVLMNFWATWCAPCLREMPSLKRLQQRLGGDDFTVIAVSEDREGSQVVAPYVERHGLDGLPIYYDAGMAASRALAVSGLPTTLLIDRQGREVGRLQGPAEWDTAEAAELVQSAF